MLRNALTKKQPPASRMLQKNSPQTTILLTNCVMENLKLTPLIPNDGFTQRSPCNAYQF